MFATVFVSSRARFTPDGSRIAIERHASLVVLESETGRTIVSTQGILASVDLGRTRAWTVDDRGVVRSYDLRTGAVVATVPVEIDALADAATDAAGDVVATLSSDGEVRIRSLTEQPLDARIPAAATRVTMSRDGSTLLTVGRDGVARVWSARSQRLLAVLPIPRGATWWDLADDGRYAIASEAGHVGSSWADHEQPTSDDVEHRAWVFPTNPSEWVVRACRDLTQESRVGAMPQRCGAAPVTAIRVPAP
jgi:WD40 repeat protein